MSDRDTRYRQQRDRYRAALVEVSSVALVCGTTAAVDYLPPEQGLHDDVHRRAQQLRLEVDRLARQQA